MTTGTQVLDAPVIDEPREGARVENRVRLKGTGEAGATVQVTTAVENRLVLTVSVLADGTWAGTAAEDLLEGTVRISALQTLGQVTSPASQVRVFTVK